MNWEDLQYFLAVARQKQLSRAAEALGTSHVTVGRRVDRLELSLGSKLFDRGPKGYALTERGAMLLRVAEDMEKHTLTLAQDLSDASPQVAGSLRLNMPEGFCHQFCAQILPGFRQAFPNLSLEVIAIQQLASFTPNINDLTVVLDPPQGHSWHSERIANYTLRVYGHREYLAARGQPQSREALLEHSFISYINEMIFMPALDYLVEVNSKIRPQLQFSSIFSQLQAVRNGSGLAVLPDFLARQHLDLVPVLGEDCVIRRSYWLACRRELRHAPREGQIIDHLISAAKALRPSLEEMA